MCFPPPLPKQLDLSTCLGKVCFLHLLLHDTSDQRLLQGNTENSGFSITSSWSTAAELLQGEPSTTVKHCIIPSLCCLDLLWESVGGALHCSLTVIMETSVFITLPIIPVPSAWTRTCTMCYPSHVSSHVALEDDCHVALQPTTRDCYKSTENKL